MVVIVVDVVSDVDCDDVGEVVVVEVNVDVMVVLVVSELV